MCAFLRRARTGWSVVLLLFVCTAHAAAVRLASDTLVGWIAYVNATETRIQHELASPSGFLVMDFVEDAAADRRATLGGTVVVQRMETIDARDRRTIVPSALVHHWRGDVLIPGVTVTQLVSELLTGPPPKQEDVLQSSVLERGPDRLKVYLKLQRKHRDEDRRAGRRRHAGGARAAGRRRPRVLVAPQRLLALRRGTRRRDCGVRVDQSQPRRSGAAALPGEPTHREHGKRIDDEDADHAPGALRKIRAAVSAGASSFP
jgi:hypothetical protein